MKLGYILPMTKALTLDRSCVIRPVEMLEDQNVGSDWTVEYVEIAKNDVPLYPYSMDGMAPTAPDALMSAHLEWLAFAAARTERINLGTSIVIASRRSAAILSKPVATLDAQRMVVSQGESVMTDIDKPRSFIRQYQDQILATA